MNEIVLDKNSNIEQYKDQQKEDLVKTIKKKEGISLLMGLEALLKAISGGSKRSTKRNNNPNQISEELDKFDKKRSKNRPPIIID